jgi:8-oxo-dGTP pyrophosphatase MutT (NUDIX family)
VIRDAATVLLLRDRAAGGYEVFLVRRTNKASFMASAMVFPGGRLDDADTALASRSALTPAAAAARLGMDDGARALGLLVAGVRETFEEAGVLLACRGDALLDLRAPEEAARFQRHRDALNAGETTLAAIAEAEDLTLAVDRLGFFAHWITPEVEPKRYDTRFLVTRAPEGQRPLHEGVETTDSAWMSPGEALAEYAARRIELAPPTLRILSEIAQLPNTDAVLALRASIPAPVAPRAQMVGTELHLLLPGDAEGARNRIVARDGVWVSEGRGF